MEPRVIIARQVSITTEVVDTAVLGVIWQR